METDRYGPVKESRAAKPGAPNQEAAMETDRYGPVKANHVTAARRRLAAAMGTDRYGPVKAEVLRRAARGILPQWRPTATGR